MMNANIFVEKCMKLGERRAFIGAMGNAEDQMEEEADIEAEREKLVKKLKKSLHQEFKNGFDASTAEVTG